MENQHRELSQEEIDLMNECKAVGETLRVLHAKIEKRVSEQYTAADLDADSGELEADVAFEAMSAATEAERNLKTGMMWLVRAVAQPAGF